VRKDEATFAESKSFDLQSTISQLAYFTLFVQWKLQKEQHQELARSVSVMKNPFNELMISIKGGNKIKAV
jgi:hypothetical protein